MKRLKKLLSVLVLLATVISLAACQSETENTDNTQDKPHVDYTTVDYADTTKLNMLSDSLKLEVTVKTFIDGDTTHFFVPNDVSSDGVLKARYLAINTPESTGKIEEYGKKASSFTKEKLQNAVSIIIESDDDVWNKDSTGQRYLVWVWYKPSEDADYRNLNIEILQNGLAIASSSANNRYGDICVSAINSAKQNKLGVYSGEKDPDFYYGDAVELTLKELRLNAEKYNGIKVAFEGVITMNHDGSAYIEDYDEDSGIYYGMAIYYGYGLTSGLNIINTGNRSRIVGTLQFYETGGTYQVAGLSYRPMKPDDPSNIKKISEGHSAAYVLTDAETFLGKISVSNGEDGEDILLDYATAVMDTSIEMKDLTVNDVYTTKIGDNAGAMTLTCTVGDSEITIRTEVLKKDGVLMTENDLIGKSISVKGLVSYFDGSYQIHVFSANDIIINN